MSRTGHVAQAILQAKLQPWKVFVYGNLMTKRHDKRDSTVMESTCNNFSDKNFSNCCHLCMQTSLVGGEQRVLEMNEKNTCVGTASSRDSALKSEKFANFGKSHHSKSQSKLYSTIFEILWMEWPKRSLAVYCWKKGWLHICYCTFFNF